MNIAVLHFHKIGGSGIVAYEIAKQMVKRGHCIHFLGLEQPIRMLRDNKDKYINQCMQFHKISMDEYPVFDYQSYSLSLASQLSDIILENNIDVIHSHYAIPHAVAAILATQIINKRIKCVTTLHGTDVTIVGSTPSMFRITQFAIEQSDAVVAVSDYLKKQTVQIFSVDEQKIQVIHNFIDFDELPTHFEEKPFKKEKIFLHASNLRTVKDPLAVIEIFYGILKKKSDATSYKLWIVGDGPLKYSMMELVKQYQIGDQVEFWGEHLDINFYIQQADFFIFPSKGESFGLAALEAMAWGVPVIATRLGGIVEIIQDGVNGILFDPGDIAQAIERTCQLIQDHQSYLKLARNAFNQTRKNFSSKSMIDAYERIYHE